MPGSTNAPVYATPVGEGEGFLVRVVRKDGGAPIPFADVYFVDLANMDQQRMRAIMAESGGLLDMVEQLATRYRAGADGSVRLPLPANQLWLAARQECWFGSLDDLTIPPEGAIIECTQMSAVAARVTNAAGQPQQNVPVQLRLMIDGRDQGILTIRTNQQGLGVIQPLDMILKNAPTKAALALQLGGIFAEPIRQGFDARDLPTEPIELILPAHGSLEVRVLTADGTPWMEPAMIHVLPRDAHLEESGGPMDNEGLSGLLREGVLLLRPLGLAQAARIRAFRSDGTTIGETICEEPLREGEIIRVEIREQSGASFVTGRAERDDGSPLVKARLEYELKLDQSGFDSENTGQIQTGEDGRFRLQIEEPALPEGGHRVLTLRTSALGALQVAEADLSWSLAPGATELRKLVFAQPPLLVSGVVVDEAGMPLAAISMQARPQVFYAKDQFYWDYDNNLVTRSGADGSFTILGKADCALIRVQGSDSAHWCEGADVAPGSTHVRVVMNRAGRIQGKLLLDDGMKSESFHLQIASGEPGDREITNWGAGIQEDGSFEFATVPPGVYRLELSPPGSNKAFVTVEGLQVRAGEDCADPRLNPLDARGQVRVMRIRAVDESGKPVRQFRVIEERADGEAEHFWASQSEALIPLRDRPSDFLIMKEGFLTVRLDDVVGDCVAQMVKGPLIRIRLSGAGALPARHVLQVGLQSASGAVQQWSGGAVEVDALGIAEFNAPLTGLCAVTLVMYGTKDETTYGAWVELPNAEIDVRPSTGTQSFTVAVEAAKLQQAIDQIAKQRK